MNLSKVPTGAFAAVLALTLVAAMASHSARAQDLPPPGKGWWPTPVEVTQLPQFCWGQFTKYKGPQYEIPKASCGSGMNHYCPGLVEQLRAMRSFGDRRMRLGYYDAARRQLLYTVKAMEKYPSCVIRQHVETTMMVVDSQWRAAGGKQR